jgi:AcrR family transcriptional regulator
VKTRPTPAPPPADRRQQRREAKLTAILVEAWRLAHRDGLAAISLRDLADAVGLRQPSLYVYFASKADLYDAMFAGGYRQMLQYLGVQRYDAEPRKALARFVADCVRFSSEDVVRHQLLFQRTIPRFEPSMESYELALELYAIAKQLAEAAGVQTQAELDVFSALVNGLAHQQIANDPGGRRWVRLADQVVEMFLADVDRRHQTTKAERKTR